MESRPPGIFKKFAKSLAKKLAAMDLINSQDQTSEILKLSPRMMFHSKDLANDPLNSEEQNAYFSCTICLKVVLDPLEC